MGADDFRFEMSARRTVISDKVILDGLRTLGAKMGGRAFTIHEYRDWEEKPCNHSTVLVRFGSWRKALAMVGITGGHTKQFEPGELMEELERVWRELKRPPGPSSLKRYGKVTFGPYAKRWGSLRRACELLAKHKRGEISREELLRVRVGGRPGLRPRVRYEVLERDGHRCLVCGKSSGERGVKLEVDHIVPVAAGGSDDKENLRTLCRECNMGKGAMLLDGTVQARRRGRPKKGANAKTASVAGAGMGSKLKSS